MWRRLSALAVTAHRAGHGLWLDTVLYLLCAVFAGLTATSSTLPAHRLWGLVAVWGYAVAALVALAQLIALRQPMPAWSRRVTGSPARAVVMAGTWCVTALLPLVIEAVLRARGQPGRAQEEVLVIEDGGRRLLDTGSPYLSRASIAALPEADRLLGYLPYQPGMALFGTPRALSAPDAWWSDARVAFAAITMAAVGLALVLLRRAGAPPAELLRGVQVAALLPLGALTLATGGDDLPVLGLCLLATAFAATRRLGWAGLAAGAAASLKLFAWPLAIILGVHAFTREWRSGWSYTAWAVGLPVASLVPALIRSPPAVVENVVTYPLGGGLVTSTARSPLPGHLLARWLPAGHSIAVALLLVAAATVGAVLIRHPPGTAAQACLLCGCGLLAAIVLLPSTRFGYLLYPTALMVWSAALRELPREPAPAAAPTDSSSTPSTPRAGWPESSLDG